VIASSRATVVAISLSVALAAPAARADSSTADQTLAQTLFDAAVKLMDQGHFAEACPKLAESQRLDPGGGTLLNLGFCREKEGKLASAWAAYNEALSQAIKDGRKDRQATAQVHVDELEGKVAKLAIDVSPDAKRIADLSIRIDGAPVRQAAWSVLSPIDRGSHTIVVTAPGKREYRTEVKVATDGTVERVSIPGLADAPVVAAPHERPPGEHHSSSQALIGWVTGGVGVVLLGVGGATGALALDAHGKSNADNNGLCGADPHQCTSAGVAYEDQAKTYAWLSDFGIGLGLAAIVTGVVLVVAAPHSSAHLTPTVGAHGGGAAFTMSF
jgi:Tfp pilus assembly protein PilF